VTDVRPPGWYDDPSGEPGRLRWWDGSDWTGIGRAPTPQEQRLGGARPPDVLDSEAGRPGSPRPRGRWLAVLLAVALIGGLVLTGRLPGLGGGRPAGSAASGASEPTAGQTEPAATEPSATEPPTTEVPVPLPTSASPTPSPKPVSGRFSDYQARLSYDVLPGSWRAWDLAPFAGLVQTAGYYRVVQQRTPAGEQYWANVTSGRVAGSGALDLRRAANLLAAGLAAEYYPAHRRRSVVERATTVDGRPAYLVRWLAVFGPRRAAGYLAKSELVVVLVVDVGRDRTSALYVSLPDPVRSAWSSLDGLLASVRVLR